MSATSLKSLGHGASSGNLSQEPANSKLNFIKDLQIRLMDMQKECYYLRCELDSSQGKLTASMQSIKQFWSPELKRERGQRKEEATKYSLLLEQYKILQSQYQALVEGFEQQAAQNVHLQQQAHLGGEGTGGGDKQAHRERSLLKKTIAELEMRIATQKQSLATKDETIKKLFHLVKTASSRIKSNDIYSSAETVSTLIDKKRKRVLLLIL